MFYYLAINLPCILHLADKASICSQMESTLVCFSSSPLTYDKNSQAIFNMYGFLFFFARGCAGCEKNFQAILNIYVVVFFSLVCAGSRGLRPPENEATHLPAFVF
jgi:hypothetical protein